MYGSCLTFALYDFLKYGGELAISFSKGQRVPHFAVQRNDKVYDLEIVKMILKELWYDGEKRVRDAKSYDHVDGKRYRILKR